MNTARQIDRPEPGYWATRLVAHGAEVGAAIIRVHTTCDPEDPANLMERSPFLAGYINGKVVDVHDVWTRRGRPIPATEYDWLLADREWARVNFPSSPEANPDKPIDVRKIPIPSFSEAPAPAKAAFEKTANHPADADVFIIEDGPSAPAAERWFLMTDRAVYFPTLDAAEAWCGENGLTYLVERYEP